MAPSLRAPAIPLFTTSKVSRTANLVAIKKRKTAFEKLSVSRPRQRWATPISECCCPKSATMRMRLQLFAKLRRSIRKTSLLCWVWERPSRDCTSHAEAVIYLQRAWDVRPGDFQAGYELALALREAKQSAAANKIMNQIAAPSDPESAVKYYSLAGVLAEDLKEFGVASGFYRRAYAMDPGSYEIYVALVRSTLSVGADPSKEVLPSPPEDLSASQELALGALSALLARTSRRFRDLRKPCAWTQRTTQQPRILHRPTRALGKLPLQSI